jgi:circadian clock protein KaiB
VKSAQAAHQRPVRTPTGIEAKRESEGTVSGRSAFKLRLYVAGEQPNSAQALANITAFCRMHLADRYELEVVNVLSEPKRAFRDGIFMTPTLVKLSPSPSRTVVGTLSDPTPLLRAFGLSALSA